MNCKWAEGHLSACLDGTLDHHFAMFEFGGKVHVVVRCSDRAFKNLERLADACMDRHQDINDVLVPMLEAIA